MGRALELNNGKSEVLGGAVFHLCHFGVAARKKGSKKKYEEGCKYKKPPKGAGVHWIVRLGKVKVDNKGFDYILSVQRYDRKRGYFTERVTLFKPIELTLITQKVEELKYTKDRMRKVYKLFFSDEKGTVVTDYIGFDVPPFSMRPLGPDNVHKQYHRAK